MGLLEFLPFFQELTNATFVFLIGPKSVYQWDLCWRCNRYSKASWGRQTAFFNSTVSGESKLLSNHVLAFSSFVQTEFQMNSEDHRHTAGAALNLKSLLLELQITLTDFIDLVNYFVSFPTTQMVISKHYVTKWDSDVISWFRPAPGKSGLCKKNPVGFAAHSFAL